MLNSQKLRKFKEFKGVKDNSLLASFGSILGSGIRL